MTRNDNLIVFQRLPRNVLASIFFLCSLIHWNCTAVCVLAFVNATMLAGVCIRVVQVRLMREFTSLIVRVAFNAYLNRNYIRPTKACWTSLAAQHFAAWAARTSIRNQRESTMETAQGVKIDFIDLKRQQKRIRQSIEHRIAKVLDHGSYILGPEVKELEDALARYTGMQYCISCGNGTDALLMALMAFDVKHGDAVFTTPFTFIATAEVIALAGATPVFVDIDERTYNIDPVSLERSIELFNKKKTGLKARGIIPVDLFGQPADYDAIGEIARRNNLFVLEDAAQGFGGTYKGKRTCSFGDIAATSFFPAKPLGCYGDGGAIFTNNQSVAETLKSIRVHGQGLDKYDNVRIGINGRLDTLQAAVLLAKMELFDEELTSRDRVASRYTHAFRERVITPQLGPHNTSSWAQYSIQVDHRDTVLQKLKEKNIPTAIYYPKPLHLQDAFMYLGHRKGDYPVTERVASKIFSIPMHPYLDEATQDRIVSAILESL